MVREMGTVTRWFKADKRNAILEKKFAENNTGKSGFGFIWGQTERDYFVHWSHIEGVGFKTLVEGQTVEFTPYRDPEKGWQAKNVVVIEDPSEPRSDQ